MPETDQPDALPDAIDPATEVENIIPPEQVPMDDAAGGPQADAPDGPVDEGTDDTDVDDLSVQGGE